jgi:hypothetical protein
MGGTPASLSKYNGAWRACPLCVLLVLTTALLT